MNWLIFSIGLICLLPKVELCYVDVLPSVAKPKNEYWEEKCRTEAGNFGEATLEAATMTYNQCYKYAQVEPYEVTESMEPVVEAICRSMFKRRICYEYFFEDVKPCTQDGEMEKIYQFVFELHDKQNNFQCNGSNNPWKTAFLRSNAYASLMFNEETLMECHSRGHCAEISEGLLAHARGGSPDSFKSLYCAMLIGDSLCLKDIFNYMGNDKAEELTQEYLEYKKELCSSYQGNGTNGNGSNENGSYVNGSNGNGSNENGSNGIGSNGIGMNGNGSIGDESSVYESSGNGSDGNGMNGNGTNGNGSNENGSYVNGSNGNGSNENGSNGIGSNGIGMNGNGSIGDESSVYESSGNGSDGNGMNGNGNNENVRDGNEGTGNGSNGNESNGNGSTKKQVNFITIAWLPLLTIAKWL
ncbi:CAR1 transcription factor-like isoform X2 [Ischnura elegans]|uniref:CAR1 transcription factor-like isoform X2 n=1 Tax=Ischnura elegans TaxID=197161 RepID=UPI001ED870E3|nr:CAR1 transcription factor-like isoform X2 [Ischnura elegans]